MILDVNKFEVLHKEGYLRRCEDGGLLLFKYNDACTYAKNWNEHTRIARGLILEEKTGKVIAKPFPKFFNLNEMPETQLANLPNEPYVITEKMDGSLGIIYHYYGEWQVATCGSLNSEQAIVAKEMLKKHDMSYISSDLTLLVEIIYPENKIVVDYKDRRELVLLGAYNRITGEEVTDLNWITKLTGIERTKQYNYTIEEMIELQKTLPKDNEGFVVRYASGLRVKIKGAEYMRYHKLLSHMTPIAFFEVMEDGEVPQRHLEQFPEEFVADAAAISDKLKYQYLMVLTEIMLDLGKLPTLNSDVEGRKQIGLFLKENKLKHSGAMFPHVLDQKDALDNYIMKYIRPDGNVFKDI